MPDTSNLEKFLLQLADSNLVLGHRNSEWTGHGPILEQDIALSNIALDLIGQARNFYQYAAEIRNDGSTENSLAFTRNERAYLNCLLAEQPNGDWGQTITRQFFFSVYHFLLYQQLENSKDERLKAIALKSLKEVSYHLRWSSEWMIRLGDGTNESHKRMQKAVDQLWPFTGELYTPALYEAALSEHGVVPDSHNIQPGFLQRVNTVMQKAGLSLPQNAWMQAGGKNGIHTEHLGYLLAEMQVLQRTYPGAEW